MTLRTIRQKARAARRQKYRGDPYVPLDPNYLRAAITEDGRSFGELARALGGRCSKQNLHHLAKRGRRCRASMRKALAGTLGVSEAWLAGTARFPTRVPIPGRELAPAFPEYPIERTHGAGGEKGFDQLTATHTPRALLAATRFTEQCYAATSRDFPAVAERGAALVPIHSLAALVDPLEWRRLLLAGFRVYPHTGVGDPSCPQPDEWLLSPTEYEELVPLLARCFEIVLKPWLEGNLRLDCERLNALREMIMDKVAGAAAGAASASGKMRGRERSARRRGTA